MTHFACFVHFTDKVLENLRAYIPLMQSIVWPAVTITAICVFRKHISACIAAIRKRIEAGGGVKAGMFELLPLPVASPHEQAKKLEDESSEESEATAGVGTPPQRDGAPHISSRDFSASYVLAEDLVMKKLSAELKLNITRQVKADLGLSYIFDGVARDNNRFIAIEVKMLRRAYHAKIIARRTLDRINTFYTSLAEDGRRTFGLILAVVIHEGTAEEVMKQLAFIRSTYHYPVHIVCYRFTELQEEFGIK